MMRHLQYAGTGTVGDQQLSLGHEQTGVVQSGQQRGQECPGPEHGDCLYQQMPKCQYHHLNCWRIQWIPSLGVWEAVQVRKVV